jgi:hypothetical protein
MSSNHRRNHIDDGFSRDAIWRTVACNIRVVLTVRRSPGALEGTWGAKRLVDRDGPSQIPTRRRAALNGRRMLDSVRPPLFLAVT